MSLIFSFLLWFSLAHPAPGKLQITHLTGDVYVYTTYNDYQGSAVPSNSMYVVTREGVVLIDTPWDTTLFQALVDSVYARHRLPVVCCIVTHFHADRTAGLDYYKSMGVKTYASKNTQAWCALRGEKQAEYTFDGDTTFTIGGYAIETFYPGEGHSPDNLVVWLERDKVVFGGCLVKSCENESLGNIADANLKTWGKSVKNVMKKYPDRAFVVPGHFDWSCDRALEHTVALLKGAKKR